MFKVIRESNIGTWDEPHYWGAVMKECETKEEAREWINKQPRWMQSELSIEEGEE